MIRKTKHILLGVMAWLTTVSYAVAFNTSDDLLKEANKLYKEYRDSEALSKFQRVLHQDPSQYEALFKASLLNVRIGARYSDETEKLEYFSAAKGYAEQALEVDPEGADAHYAMALALNNLSMVNGMKDRVVQMKAIRKHLDKALARNTAHAEAWQLLGRWHYKAANFNFVESAAAKFLTGGSPVGASNYNAIEALKKSITYNPQNISSYYDLAIIYRDMHNKEASVEILVQAIKLNLVTAEDLELSRRCKALLREIAGNHLG